MFCTQCGKQIPDGSKFCPECGNSLDAKVQGSCSAQEPLRSTSSHAPTQQSEGQGIEPPKKTFPIKIAAIGVILIALVVICCSVTDMIKNNQVGRNMNEVEDGTALSTPNTTNKGDTSNKLKPATTNTPEPKSEPEIDGYMYNGAIYDLDPNATEVPNWFHGTLDEYRDYIKPFKPVWYDGTDAEYIEQYGRLEQYGKDEYISTYNSDSSAWDNVPDSDRISDNVEHFNWHKPFGYFLGLNSYLEIESAMSILYDADLDKVQLCFYDQESAQYGYDMGFSFVEPAITTYIDPIKFPDNEWVIFYPEGEDSDLVAGFKIYVWHSVAANDPNDNTGDHIEIDVDNYSNSPNREIYLNMVFNTYYEYYGDWDSIQNYPY